MDWKKREMSSRGREAALCATASWSDDSWLSGQTNVLFGIIPTSLVSAIKKKPLLNYPFGRTTA